MTGTCQILYITLVVAARTFAAVLFWCACGVDACIPSREACGHLWRSSKFSSANIVKLTFSNAYRLSWDRLADYRTLDDVKQALRNKQHSGLVNLRSICWKVG